MNSVLAFLALAIGISIAVLIPNEGQPALVFGIVLGAITSVIIYNIGQDRKFLLQIFIIGFLLRVMVGALIFRFELQNFFGGDAYTYDGYGFLMMRSWRYGTTFADEWFSAAGGGGWGMIYLVGFIYTLVGRNMLAIQFFNAVVGAATAPVIFLCAHHIFRNSRVSRVSAYLVALYPSLILWSSQGLKDAPVIFLLALAMLAILKLGEKLSVKYFLILIVALLGILTMRFYVFYMLVAAIGGAFAIGTRAFSAQSLLRQFVIIIGIGLTLTYLGVSQTASVQFESFANLEAVQNSRATQSRLANSGFANDVDVSTTSGALTAIPLGLTYLLFAPFPWQLFNLRQSITLPEMIVWWGAFPIFVLGLWFAIKYRLRQVLPILLFTLMLTLAYALVQGNVGTAYRQRSQLLVFYFIFVAVGMALLGEVREAQRQHALEQKEAILARRSPQKL
ncbi:MAG TPA: glycosyltransferase family 39 protein [Pyrinomonadaceae bacterium]|jgi:4-amino-4-deoxy-L-arabinose transferase-like glycosyltransferase|nr:glycosyltransferase family 39 protein [Pyrinomonadaceae bacterium]